MNAKKTLGSGLDMTVFSLKVLCQDLTPQTDLKKKDMDVPKKILDVPKKIPRF